MTMKHALSKFSLAIGVAAGALTVAATAASADMDNTFQFGSFEDIDSDRSGYIENGEYQAHAFGKADWDNDGYLENSEYVRYTETVYDPYDIEYDSYTYYDTDGDGFIDRSEFNDMPTSDLYEAWDADDNNQITDTDWDEVSAYYYDDD